MKSKEASISGILDVCQYLFYRLYVWQLSMFGEAEKPRFTALLGNSICIAFNLLTLHIIFQFVTGYDYRIENIYGVIGMLLIMFINYFLLHYGNKSRVIIAKFSAESEIQRIRRTIYCRLYSLYQNLLRAYSDNAKVYCLLRSFPFLPLLTANTNIHIRLDVGQWRRSSSYSAMFSARSPMETNLR